MEVGPAVEGRHEVLVRRQVRKKPELDLRVVAGEEHRPFGDGEGRAHTMPQLGARGDVLQVGVRAREAARRRHGLVERGVDATVTQDVGRQCVEVGGLDLGALAVLEDVGHHVMAGGQVREHLCVRRVEARTRLLETKGGQTEHVKEYVTELLRGIEVEVLPRLVLDVSDHLANLDAQLARLLGEDGRVDGESRALHGGEHGEKRHLDSVEELARAVRLERRVEPLAQGRHRHGVDGRLGNVDGRLGKRAVHVLLEESRHGEVTLVGVEQVARHAHVEDAGRVHLRRIEGRLRGRVHGAHHPEQRLDVSRDETPRAKEADEGRHTRVALHAKELAPDGKPHHVGLLPLEERTAAPALVGPARARRRPMRRTMTAASMAFSAPSTLER